MQTIADGAAVRQRRAGRPRSRGPALLGAGHGEAVTDRQHHQFHPVVAEYLLVEILDRLGVGIRGGGEDAAVQEGVVDQEDAARPIIYSYDLATCRYPRVHNVTIMVNSLFNGWRFEDAWLDK